jgi:hypothetical protein
VALVPVFKRLVNEKLVSAAFAWVYTGYLSRFARGGKRWSMRPEMPSEGFGVVRTQYRLGSLRGREEASNYAEFFRYE